MPSAFHPPNASSALPPGTSPPAGTVGLDQVIRIAIGTNASYSSATAIPANAVILRAFLDITTNYGAEPGPVTIEMGTTADGLGAFMGINDNVPPNVALYDAPQDTVSAGGVLVVTIGGSPNEGAGFACVEFSAPFS